MSDRSDYLAHRNALVFHHADSSRLSNDPAFQGIYFAHFDVDEVTDVTETVGLRVIPTFAVFIDGEETDRVAGGDMGKLREYLQNATRAL